MNLDGFRYLSECANKKLAILGSQNRLRNLALDSCGETEHWTDLRAALERASNKTIAFHQLNRQSQRASTNCTVAMREVRNFNLNDYLGIGRNRLLQFATQMLAETFPIGGQSSRLLGGDWPIYPILENFFAESFAFESALYVGTGFAANELLPQVLSFPDVAFFSDAANHASLIDGMRLSKVPRDLRFVFPHLNFANLEEQLSASSARCNVIFCESVFSMDGDQSDLVKLKSLADHYRGVLVIDEAHAFGTFGPNGRGLIAEHGISNENVIGVYTCGKSLATQGALIGGPKWLRQLIINQGRPFIYTTAPSPLVVAVTYVSLKLMTELNLERKNLQLMASRLRSGLNQMGYDTGDSSTQIIPVILGSDERAIGMSRLLKDEGYEIGAARPPTVPVGKSRLRISLHAGVDDNQIDCFLKNILHLNTKLAGDIR